MTFATVNHAMAVGADRNHPAGIIAGRSVVEKRELGKIEVL
jgi:hypothetical protein